MRLFEHRDMRGVPEGQRPMTLEKVFWSHFTPNLVPAAWLVGGLLAIIGLGFWPGLAAVVIGNILGATPVALLALLGPKTGLTQIETSRFSFGRVGVRVPAAVNWVSCVGWDAVNNVPSALALVALAGLLGVAGMPYTVVLALLVAVQMVVGIWGHHVVQLTEKYLGYALMLVFAVVGVLALWQGGATFAGNGNTLSNFILGTAIVASFNLAWAPYSSDYTSYLPRQSSSRAVFLRAFWGLFLSAAAVEFFGLATSGFLPKATFAERIVGLTGGFAPLALLTIGLSSLAVNALNDNTGAYSLISAGIRVPRPASAAIAALLGFALAWWGQGQYAEKYEAYLLVLLYWIAPWSALVLTDWWLHRREVPREVPEDWRPGAVIFALTSVLTIWLFASTPLYTGPIAKALSGADIGYYVGFAAAALAYAAYYRLSAPRQARLEVAG